MDSLSFHIPEQQTPTKNSFDIRPQAVQRWVDELPVGDTGEAARRLYTMLKQINRLKFAPALRVELMQIISPTLETVLDTLMCHYSGLSFPLPQKSVRIAQFSNHLLVEVVIAYQTILNARNNSSWLFRTTHHALSAQSIHRMMVYLNRILTNYRIIHRQTPAGIWLTLHQLYYQAQKHGRNGEKVELPNSMRRRTTIEQEYKRALLLSLLEPQLFRLNQMEEVQGTMEHWIEGAKLIPAEQCHKGLAGYCIRADQDSPHTLPREQCSKACNKGEPAILLDVSGLQKSIGQSLEQVGAGGSAGPASPVSRDTLELLQQCWKVPEGQRQERLKSNRTVQAAVGMSANYMLLHRHSIIPGGYGISDQVMSDALHPMAEKVKPASPGPGAENKPGGKDIVFSGTELGHNAWAMDAEAKNYQFISARELDYTETGHCLVFNSADIESLQVGELIGFRESKCQALQLCMVRWLQDHDTTISVGLKRLATEVEPVLVVGHQQLGNDEQKTAFGCLLGIGEDYRPQLFLPNLPGGQERRLYLAVDGNELPVTLHERVALSPLFEAYHFVAAELLHEPSTGEDIPLAEVNSRLHRLAHRELPPTSGDKDDFTDVWDLL